MDHRNAVCSKTGCWLASVSRSKLGKDHNFKVGIHPDALIGNCHCFFFRRSQVNNPIKKTDWAFCLPWLHFGLFNYKVRKVYIEHNSQGTSHSSQKSTTEAPSSLSFKVHYRVLQKSTMIYTSLTCISDTFGFLED